MELDPGARASSDWADGTATGSSSSSGGNFAAPIQEIPEGFCFDACPAFLHGNDAATLGEPKEERAASGGKDFRRESARSRNALNGLPSSMFRRHSLSDEGARSAGSAPFSYPEEAQHSENVDDSSGVSEEPYQMRLSSDGRIFTHQNGGRITRKTTQRQACERNEHESRNVFRSAVRGPPREHRYFCRLLPAAHTSFSFWRHMILGGRS